MDWKWLTLGVIILLMFEEGESQIPGRTGVCTRYESYRASTKASIRVKTRTCNRVRLVNICRDKYVTRYQVEYNSHGRRRRLYCCSGYRLSNNNCYPICSPTCRNGGTCVKPGTCRCPSGWTGSYCQTPICRPTCLNRGRCTRPDTCSCSRGWSGSYCQTPICSPYCRNGGTCTHPNTCRCRRGWTGSFCQTPACSPTCRNGGTCVKPGTCRCPSGWTGSYCQTSICSPTCRNGGRCTHPNTCSCPSGWSGSYCQTAVCSPSCLNGGRCTQPDTCSCPSGWSGSYCQTAICSPPCRNGGSCIHPNTCICPTGWTGSYCEIGIAMCSPSCRNGGICIRPNTCNCLTGWTGSYCQTAVCSPSCHNGGRCIHPNTCSCPSGWRGSYCQTAICSPPCRNGGRCIHPNTCSCSTGWTGSYCEIAVCSPSCRNGGRCTWPDTCSCPSGWSGSYCQTAICSPSCRNGGSCIRPNTCSCSTGWTGSYCEIGMCSPSCRNGGICIRPNICNCSTGWTGSYCQTGTCNPPCQNGGTCLSSGSCRCPSGWFGSTCRSSSGGLSCSSPLRNIIPRLFSHCSGVTLPPPCIYGNWTKWTLSSEIKSTPNCESKRAWAQTRVRNALTLSCSNQIQEQRKYICQPTQNQTLETMKRVLKLGKIETTVVTNLQNLTRGKRQSKCPNETDQENNRICEYVCGKRKRSILSEFDSKPTGHIVKIQELDPSIPVEPFHIPGNEHHLRHRRESEDVRYFLFILDSSGSISEDVFTAKKEVLATIAKHLCGHIKVAMITYSTDVNLEFCFDCYDSRMDIANAILRAPYHNALTRTHKAMKCVHEQLLNPTLCDLPELPQLDVITLTDGHHNGQCSMTLDAAVDLLAARENTNLYAIGYGNIDEDGVKDVVKNDDFDHIFLTNESYDLAFDIAQAIENAPYICLNSDGSAIPT